MDKIGGILNLLIIPGIILVALVAIGFLLARLYTRASKEISFVRTGAGGQKVILNGGALVLPVLHEVIPVNMNTLRLEVSRKDGDALITKDRMRVNVEAEFYVRVKPTQEAIADAAQTLGTKTTRPEELRSFLQGKFVNALRTVAALMAMKELHEQRVEFVQKVQQTVIDDLNTNGMELETVSLTGLDQTSKEFFNPDNAFDAEGLTRLTEEIEDRRKKRNIIEQDANVAIAQKNLEAEQKQLMIQQQEEEARLNQTQEIETMRAAQETEIALKQAEQRRESEQASINADREIGESEISKAQLLEEKGIEKERAVELAEQATKIAIAEKSKEESEARAEADKALALAVAEEEAVVTVRKTAEAERKKAIEILKANEDAERLAIELTVAADAKKQAAKDEAEAILTLATAETDAAKLRAEADAVNYEVTAKGTQAVNEAANTLSAEQVEMQVRFKLIEQAPNIITASVKPMESIGDIKIIQVEGLTGSGSGGDGAKGNGSSGNLADDLTNAALRYRGQAPLVDSLLKDIGLSPGNINQLHGLGTQDKPLTVESVPAESDLTENVPVIALDNQVEEVTESV